jgi:repressor LexA
MVNRGQFYALTIEGDSMIEAGILDGDTVIIKKADTANNGEIVVALVDESEATLKILKRENNEVVLIPCNSAYQPRRLPAQRVRVQGVLAGLMRSYH